MKILRFICLFGLAVTSTQVLAYGSSSSSKSCVKPQFSAFTPPEKTKVAPKSNFSFVASATTNPKSIEVTIKQQAVDITVAPNSQGYLVSGTLPADLKGVMARISIDAKTQSQCQGGGGWLIKISD